MSGVSTVLFYNTLSKLILDLASQAKNQDQNEKLNLLRGILSKVMHSGGNSEDDKMQQGEDMKAKSQAYNFNPDDIMPKDVQNQL
jgi:hypothetical protein